MNVVGGAPILLLFVVAVAVLTLSPPASGLAAAAAAAPVPPLAKTAEHLPLARQAMAYLDASTDPFHAVQTSVDLLETAGFEALDDADAASSYTHKIRPGGKYYFTRHRSTLVAFAVGRQYRSSSEGAEGGGFKIIGGHTDSPNLRVKPRCKRGAVGCIQLGVECYGGGTFVASSLAAVCE